MGGFRALIISCVWKELTSAGLEGGRKKKNNFRKEKRGI